MIIQSSLVTLSLQGRHFKNNKFQKLSIKSYLFSLAAVGRVQVLHHHILKYDLFLGEQILDFIFDFTKF